MTSESGVTREISTTDRFRGPRPGGASDRRSIQASTLAALFAAGAVAVAVPSGAAAQEELPEADTVPVSELRVTVTRTDRDRQRSPEAISVLGTDAVAQGERRVSLEESLRFVPGVYAQNRRNFSLGDRVTIRGVGARAQFGVRGIQILMDGIPLTMPDGQAAVDPVDLNSVGRVEVIRGPASTLYGNAAGGVVSYRTRSPWSGDFRTEPEISFGSHGYNKAVVGASGSADDFGWRLTGQRMETDGFRQNAGAEIYHGNLVASQKLSDDTELRGILNVFHTPFAENPSGLTREDAMENPGMARDVIQQMGAGQETTHGQGGLALAHRLSEDHRIEAIGWMALRDIRNPIPFRIIDLDRTAGGVRSQYQGGADAGDVPVSWTAGVDFGVQSDDRRELGNEGVPSGGDRAEAGDVLLEQREQVTSFGPFARVDVDVHPDWRLTVGGRYDRFEFDIDDRFLEDGDDSGDRTLEAFSPMAGVTWSPREEVSLYANYATSFETPTASEFSNRPGGGGGINPDLDAADTESWELGAKGWLEDAGVRYDLALYLADVDDALVPFSDPTEQVFFRNAGEITRAGVESSLEWRPTADLAWRLAYTYQHSEFDEFTPEGEDFSDNREPGVPEHQLTAGVSYTTPFGVTSEVDARWVDAYPVNDANSAFNWSYRVVDVRFSMDRGLEAGRLQLQPFLGVDNVFDERYNGAVTPNAFGGRFYEPAPGATVYGGISLGVPSG
ncbi:MAG: TonB-dependent receptor family protein [Gemmatimonadota bacterium]